MSYGVFVGYGDSAAHVVFDQNYTFNGAQLWRDYLHEDGLTGLYGMTGAEAAEHLSVFFSKLNSNLRLGGNVPLTEHLRDRYNPVNGWGCFEAQLALAGELMAVCYQHPTAKVTVFS